MNNQIPNIESTVDSLAQAAEGLPWFAGLAGVGALLSWILVWGFALGAGLGVAVVFGWMAWVARYWIAGIFVVLMLLAIILPMF